MNFIKWIIRFILWCLSGFGLFDKILFLQTGTDYLHPLAPYSFGGLKRVDFLSLHRITDGSRPVSNSFLQKKLGADWSNRSKFVYQYFLSPWKVNYNYK